MVEDGEPQRLGPKGGKGYQLGARITQELREALDAEASRTGRSLSQVVELWLEDARKGRASAEEQMGGREVAPVFRAMSAAAQEIEAMYGPPSADWRAHAAMLGAWSAIARTLLPKPGPDAKELELSIKSKLQDGSKSKYELEEFRQSRRTWLLEYSAGAADAYAERLEAILSEPAPANES